MDALSYGDSRARYSDSVSQSEAEAAEARARARGRASESVASGFHLKFKPQQTTKQIHSLQVYVVRKKNLILPCISIFVYNYTFITDNETKVN